MHRLTLLCLAALTGCGHRPEPVLPAYRDNAAQIYSSAVLDSARLQGHWVQVAGFAGGALPCAPGAVDIAGGDVRWSLCLDRLRTGAGPMRPGKTGRFAVAGTEDWWLLWVDADDRTMVVGTPSGHFGFVLNREASLPADRTRAVRDILQFNSYDLAKLRFY